MANGNCVLVWHQLSVGEWADGEQVLKGKMPFDYLMMSFPTVTWLHLLPHQSVGGYRGNRGLRYDGADNPIPHPYRLIITGVYRLPSSCCMYLNQFRTMWAYWTSFSYWIFLFCISFESISCFSSSQLVGSQFNWYSSEIEQRCFWMVNWVCCHQQNVNISYYLCAYARVDTCTSVWVSVIS